MGEITIWESGQRLLCECDGLVCPEILPIDEATYTNFRRQYPKAAVVLPGHQRLDNFILEENLAYLVVQQGTYRVV